MGSKIPRSTPIFPWLIALGVGLWSLRDQLKTQFPIAPLSVTSALRLHAASSVERSASQNGKPSKWQVSFPRAQGEGKLFFEFVPNPAARPIPFLELVGVLRDSRIAEQRYVLDEQDCKHFAHQLYVELQRKGIASRFAGIQWAGRPVGHALVAIETTDQGRVFVDFTPAGIGDASKPQRAFVWVKLGDPTWRQELERVPLGFEYNRAAFERFDNSVKNLAADHRELGDRKEYVETTRAQLQRDWEALRLEASAGELTQDELDVRQSDLRRREEALNREIADYNDDVNDTRATATHLGPVTYTDEPVIEVTYYPPEGS